MTSFKFVPPQSAPTAMKPKCPTGPVRIAAIITDAKSSKSVRNKQKFVNRNSQVETAGVSKNNVNPSPLKFLQASSLSQRGRAAVEKTIFLRESGEGTSFLAPLC